MSEVSGQNDQTSPTGPTQKRQSSERRTALLACAPRAGAGTCLSSCLGAVVALGLAAFAWQVSHGMYVTGKNRPVMWALYITGFVFWVGLSHSGTMVSAILRLSKANWRRPILRAAEAMTVFSISVAGLFPLIHLGRNWIFYYLIPYPNQRGTLAQLPFGPLVGRYRHHQLHHRQHPLPLPGDDPGPGGGPRPLHGLAAHTSTLSWPWGGAERPASGSIYQKASTLMAALIIPVAVSVHSIVAWDFAVTVVPGWHSTIFPPYFVIGAILSGVAAVITLMIVIRKVFHLEEYLTPMHFDNMGKILLVISLLWTYAYFVEVQTIWYAHEPIEWEVFSFMSGRYTPQLLLMLLGNSVLPIFCTCFKRLRRSIGVMLVVTLMVNVAMFIERFLIIVPSLSHKNMPFAWGSYTPSLVECSINLGALAGFMPDVRPFRQTVPHRGAL